MPSKFVAAALSAAFLFAAPGAAHSDPSPAPSAVAGLPATDRAWTPTDFRAAANALLATPHAQLPRINSASSIVLDRLSASDSWATCHDQSQALEGRLEVCLDGFRAILAIAETYSDAQRQDASIADDTMRVCEGLIHGAGTLMRLMDEFVPTLDRNDPSYSARMAGAEQARQGVTTMVSGGVIMLNERHIFSAPARARFAIAVAEAYPSLRASFSPDARAQIEQSLRTLATSDPDPGVRAALAAFAS